LDASVGKFCFEDEKTFDSLATEFGFSAGSASKYSAFRDEDTNKIINTFKEDGGEVTVLKVHFLFLN